MVQVSEYEKGLMIYSVRHAPLSFNYCYITGYSTILHQLEKSYGIGWNAVLVSNNLDLEV
jgi:uncharacterized protein YybS (DUF2232 family)